MRISDVAVSAADGGHCDNSKVVEHPDSHSEVIPFLRITSSVNVEFSIIGELGRENDLTVLK
jgi:hypothetical protein